MSTLEIGVDIVPLPLTKHALQALRSADTYDHVIFTSKNAEGIFLSKLRKLKSTVDKKMMIRVGPRKELLNLPLQGKRVLFPRSALAPFDIVRKLRKNGVVVRTVRLYTAHGKKLSSHERNALLSHKVDRLYFKSPSGIEGLLRQIPRKERQMVLKIPALCIGETTAKAARRAGWNNIQVKR
jgi:uroporphyrinogen-III synthase